MKSLVAVFFLIGSIAACGSAADVTSPASKKVAIFVANRAKAELNDQMPVFEDMVTSQVTDLGFEVISREVVLGAVDDLLRQSGRNSLDAMLDDRTSSLRLAQNLGADYLLFVSFIGMDHEKRAVKAYGVSYDNYVYTLRGTYRILDGNTGGSLTSGMVEPTRSIQQTEHSETSAPGLIRELLAKASRDIASSLDTKHAGGQIKEVRAAREQVEFQIAASLNEVSFPKAEIDAEGNVKIITSQAVVEPLAVSVELDGFVIGTTAQGALTKLKASPGLHRIRLAREDLVPFERMINVHEGLKLEIALQLNDAGLSRWKERIRVVNDLLQKTKLNDAEVERIRGEAQKLRQSGYNVDIQVKTDEGVTFERNQSLLNQD
jgi:hypothetical protein